VPAAQDYLGGKYRLINLLRVGKTCQLWEAINDNEGKRYAIKVLLPEYVNDKPEVKILRHEFDVGSKLDHPRVIRHFAFGNDSQNAYLVMEMFHAPNIKMIIQQGAVDEISPQINKVVSQAAEGLAYFHKQGWVHRDIKPDNYLLKPNGDTKLIDFALAQKLQSKFMPRLPSRFHPVQGTRSYMSPEQIRGQRLDLRADVYSFGCMLYELVVGKPPFTGSSTNELLNKHLSSAPPPVQAFNKNVTEAFGNLIKRLLAKKPEDRPSSMDDVLMLFHGMKVFVRDPRTAST
jgi:eukaryotic-like serine/threonine-protein kinase